MHENIGTFKANAFNSQYQEIKKSPGVGKVGKSRNRSIEVNKQVDILTQSIDTQPEKQKTEQKQARLSPEINIKLSFGGKGKEFTIGLDPKELG